MSFKICIEMVDFVVIFIAFLTLITTIGSLRYQLIQQIYSFAAMKAQECNSYLPDYNMSKFPDFEFKVSSLFSSIVIFEEYLAYTLKGHILRHTLNPQKIIDIFYLQLHTTIREFLRQEDVISYKVFKGSSTGGGPQTMNPAMQHQYLELRRFLSKSIEKNESKEFEKYRMSRIELYHSDNIN